MNIRIITTDKETIELEVNPNDTIDKIINKIKEKGKEVVDINLKYHNKILAKSYTIAKCKIENNSELESVANYKSIQILTLGNSNVGKTSILKEFEGEEFKENRYITLGIDFIHQILKIGNCKVSVKIWDTAGQERFHTITKSTYSKCQGILLVFDIAERKSFDQIDKWINNIKENSPANAKIYLLGNKADVEEREVEREEAMKLAKDHNMTYFETSAKTGQNVKNAIRGLVIEIYEQFIGVIPEGIKLEICPSHKKGLKKCC